VFEVGNSILSCNPDTDIYEISEKSN